MGVLVCYDDFTYDVINDYYLDYLVQTGCIIGYDKSGEWVKTENPAQRAAVLKERLSKSQASSASNKN
jgi:hypothetical protein